MARISIVRNRVARWHYASPAEESMSTSAFQGYSPPPRRLRLDARRVYLPAPLLTGDDLTLRRLLPNCTCTVFGPQKS